LHRTQGWGIVFPCRGTRAVAASYDHLPPTGNRSCCNCAQQSAGASGNRF